MTRLEGNMWFCTWSMICTDCCKNCFIFSCSDGTKQREYSAVDDQGNAFLTKGPNGAVLRLSSFVRLRMGKVNLVAGKRAFCGKRTEDTLHLSEPCD